MNNEKVVAVLRDDKYGFVGHDFLINVLGRIITLARQPF